MKIKVISVAKETKNSKDGKPYQVLTVTYSAFDKTSTKAVFSFGNQEKAFKVLETAEAGQYYDVVVAKNASGYNDWISVTKTSEEAAATEAKPAPRSNFETPEERAARQVLIVRQSSISTAATILTAGAKTPPKIEEVLAVAQQIACWVFQRPFDKGMPEDMTSDIPF